MHLVIFVDLRNFGVSFKTEVKPGASHNGQKSTCPKTIRISLTGCARSVLVAPWNIDDKATMVHVCTNTFLPTLEASVKGLGHAILGNFSIDQVVIELTEITK